MVTQVLILIRITFLQLLYNITFINFYFVITHAKFLAPAVKFIHYYADTQKFVHSKIMVIQCNKSFFTSILQFITYQTKVVKLQHAYTNHNFKQTNMCVYKYHNFCLDIIRVKVFQNNIAQALLLSN